MATCGSVRWFNMLIIYCHCDINTCFIASFQTKEFWKWVNCIKLSRVEHECLHSSICAFHRNVQPVADLSSSFSKKKTYNQMYSEMTWLSNDYHVKTVHKLVHHLPLWPLEPLPDKHQLCFKCYSVFRFTIVTFNCLVKRVITGVPPTVFHSGQIMNKLPLTRNT